MEAENKVNTLLTIFRDSFTDLQFNKIDKKAIKEFIRSNTIGKREKDLVRSNLFNLVRSHNSIAQNIEVINWLEEANKSLFTKQHTASLNQVFFSPGDECVGAIINRIKLATESIEVCVYTISDDRISDILLKSHQCGLSIKIITDNDKFNDKGSDIKRLSNEGISIKMDTTESLMHHKFAVIDHQTAITGSYNWTRSAAVSNQENLLVTDIKEIVLAYITEFDRLWDTMTDFTQ